MGAAEQFPKENSCTAKTDEKIKSCKGRLGENKN